MKPNTIRWATALALALPLSATLLPSAHAQLSNLLNNLVKPGANGQSPAAGLLNLNAGQQNNKPAVSANDVTDALGMLKQSVEEIDEPKEIEIGRNLAAVLLGAKPLHPDMKLQNYVNRLGRWISLQSSRPDLPWTFAVLDDKGYNAFAAPGGFVFVTKGLVDACKDESELAGVLAHEINHVLGKHHLKAIRKSAQTGLLAKLAATQVSKNVPAGLSEQLMNIGRDLYSKGLDQGDELEADRNGVALAARAGFDPYGLVGVLSQLRTVAPDNPEFFLQMSTHPPAQVRLDQLELAMGQRLDGFVSTKAPVPLAQKLAKLK